MGVRAWAPKEGFLLLPVHREEHNSVLLNLVKLKARSEFMIAKETDSFVKLVRKELTGALEQAAGSFDQRGATAFKAYNEFYKEGAGVFERSVVADLLNSKPSLLVNSIKAVEDAQALKKALEYGSKSSDPVAQQQVKQAWRQFQEQYMQNQMFRTKGAVDLSAISKRLVDKKELLGEIFSDAQGKQAPNNVKGNI